MTTANAIRSFPFSAPRNTVAPVTGLRLKADLETVRMAIRRHTADNHDPTNCRACADLARRAQA